MGRTRVKVCGITRPEDGLAAARAGVDAIGLVFYPPSSRFVSTQAACAVIEVLPPLVTVVGLFLDASRDQIDEVLRQVPLDVLQFHGVEEPAFCASFGKPYIKGVAMSGLTDVCAYLARYAGARGYLMDSHRSGQAGGTGERFDWRHIPADLGDCLILAGGLNPGNVGEAVRRVRPWAVDVSTGVEQAKGIKDPRLIVEFVEGVESGESR